MSDRPSARLLRPLWLVLAYLCLALGLVGIAIPGLPTTPFVLVAAFAADRGSPRLHAWLLRHRVFGPMIRDWRDQRAVSRRAKLLAVGVMMLSAVIMFTMVRPLVIPVGTTAIMASVAVWLWRRPEPTAVSADEDAVAVVSATSD